MEAWADRSRPASAAVLGSNEHADFPTAVRWLCHFPMFGITQSKMNPNICTICERAFRKVQKRRHISAAATILFADIRGYTRSVRTDRPNRNERNRQPIPGSMRPSDQAQADIVNKQMGDGLMAIFNFPIKIERHAEAAVARPSKSNGVARRRWPIWQVET